MVRGSSPVCGTFFVHIKIWKKIVPGGIRTVDRSVTDAVLSNLTTLSERKVYKLINLYTGVVRFRLDSDLKYTFRWPRPLVPTTKVPMKVQPEGKSG